MATRTTVTLEDDLDGGQAEETVRFGLGAVEYQIDLSAANASRLRSQLAPFVEHARTLAGASGPGQDARRQRVGTARRCMPGLGTSHRDQRTRPGSGQCHRAVRGSDGRTITADLPVARHRE